MSDWLSYRFQDFIPFTLETYNDVLMRANSEHWPWHALVVTLALLACFYAIKGRPFIALIATSMLWACCAFFFFADLYVEINVAGTLISYIFYLQSTMMLSYGAIMALSKPAGFAPADRLDPDIKIKCLGSLMVIASLLVYPVYGIFWLNDLQRTEFPGLHPDPTAILTLGLLFMTVKGIPLLVLQTLPLLWLLVSWQTLESLHSELSLIPLSALILGTLGLILNLLTKRKSQRWSF